MRHWAGPLGSCVLYSSCPTDPSLSAGPGVVPFARLFAFLPSRRPPHSVRGHGLGNRAAKQRHGTVGFSCSFFFCRPAGALLSSEPGGGQGKLATHTVAQDCMFCLLSDARCFVFSFDMRFRLGTFPPSRDCGLCHLSILCWFSPLVSPPPPRWKPAGGF